MAYQSKVRLVFRAGTAAALVALSVVVAVSATTSARAVQRVGGTLSIAAPVGPGWGTGVGPRQSSVRPPYYVSTGTRHAALFIDGASTPAGQTASCSASNGTGTGCTITWSASLLVPANHSFAVEIDTGTTVSPNNTVLAEGKASYTVFPGTNTLGSGGNGNPLSLNGVVTTYFYNITGCVGASCTGTITPADAASFSIFYAGSLTTPTQGVPTSGNVFDNNGGGSNNYTIASDTPSIGTMTGTAQAPWTSVGTNALNILAVNSTDQFTYQVTCGTGATGKFGLISSGATTASGDVTATELSGLSPVVAYPANGSTDTTNLFTCTSGVASNASGTVVTN